MRARNTVIMAVVALLLAAAVYFLEIRGAEEREAAESVAARLLHFEPDDVTGLTITTGDDSIVMTRVDDGWSITDPYELAADQTAVSGIISRLQGADHERVVEEAPEDLARFGLDAPEVSVTLELADGSSAMLAFGGGTPVGFNVFVKTGADDTVYTAAAGIKDAVNKTLFDLRDRRVLNFADADVKRVEITGDAVDATVERLPDQGDGIVRWALTEPLAARADADTVGALLQGWRNANAVAFASDAPDDEELAAFGLTEPAITLRLWTDEDAAHTLQIGGSAEEPAGRYARRLGSDAVMIVPGNLVNELPGSADALRNRTVVEFARDRVDAVAVQHGDETLRIEKDGVDWRITAPRPLDGDAGAVASLLSSALALRTREFPAGAADAARFGFADPYARVSFELEALPGDDTTEGQAAETVTLLLGAATEVDPEDAADGAADAAAVAARYVRVEGDPTVFVVEEEDLGDIDVDLFTLRSKTLVSFAQSDLTRLELSTPDASVALSKNEQGEWTRDGEAIPEAAATAVDDALWRLNYLDMQSIVAEPASDADLAAHGLDAPRLRLRALIDGELAGEVAVGDDVPDDELQDLPPFAPRTQTYATASGVAGLFRIDANLRDAVQALLDALS